MQRAELTEVSEVEMPIQGPSRTVLLALVGGARRSYLIGNPLRKSIQLYQGCEDFIFLIYLHSTWARKLRLYDTRSPLSVF